MPFNPFRREQPVQATSRPGGGRALAPRPVAFDGLSDEWRLVGMMRIEGRLSDALNHRQPIELTEMRWASLVDGGALEEAPGLKVIDPYDLILVMAGEGSLPPMTEAERAALRVHKLTYDVELDLPPFVVRGKVYLFPGTDPSVLLERVSDMFIPVTHAVASLGGQRVNPAGTDVILVNRFYLRGVEQLPTEPLSIGAGDLLGDEGPDAEEAVPAAEAPGPEAEVVAESNAEVEAAGEAEEA